MQLALLIVACEAAILRTPQTLFDNSQPIALAAVDFKRDHTCMGKNQFCCSIDSTTVANAECAGTVGRPLESGESCCGYRLKCAPAAENTCPDGVECQSGHVLNLTPGVETSRRATGLCGGTPDAVLKGMDWLRAQSSSGLPAVLLLALGMLY